MKRVLNSGTIRLPQVTGNEKERLDTIRVTGIPDDTVIKFIFENNPAVLKHISFKFEIKAPLLVFNTIQETHLGTLDRLEEQDRLIAYLPPSFYKQDGSTFSVLDPKTCNVQNTRLYNFYVAAINYYNNLLQDGICEEQARLVLPQGIFVNFLWEVNGKDLIEFIEKNHNQSPEMYGYCSTFVIYLEEHLPLATRWLRANRWSTFSL